MTAKRKVSCHHEWRNGTTNMACFSQAIQHVFQAWPYSWCYCHGMFLINNTAIFYEHFTISILMSAYCIVSIEFQMLPCIISTGIRILFHSYPLLHIPLPGTIPTKIILPYESQTDSIKSSWIPSNTPNDAPTNSDKFENVSVAHPPFAWANSEPFVYIQQIVLRSSVLPWHNTMKLTDAYRGPLHEIFKLLEIVRNHEDETR